MSIHTINKFAAHDLIVSIQRASGLNQRDFTKLISTDAELEITNICNKVKRKQVQADDEAEKYVLPAGLNVEQHLFNLAFNDPAKPIKLINFVFSEYDADAGYWVGIPEDQMKQRILAIAEKAKYPDTKKKPGKSLGTASNIDKTLAYAAIKLWHNSESVSNSDLLAFRNGTVSIKTGKLSSHSPTNYLTFGLPYDYNEGAKCPPVMQQFINSSYGQDQTEYIRAAIGLMLDLNAPNKCIHAVGPSGSGKGTFCELIRKMFSKDSVSTPTDFTAWSSPETAQQQLAGKRLFLIDDLLGSVGKELGGFHSGVEQKAINCRVLWAKQSYSAPMRLRAIFASTGPLKTSYSTSHGLRRRVFPLPTLREIANPDRTLETRLEEELGDIVSWALAMDKAERNAIIEHPEYYNELAADYFTESACHASSVWAFLESCIQPVTPKENDLKLDQDVEMGRLYSEYRAYCCATNKQSLTLDNFKGELKQAIPYNFISRRKSGAIPARFVYFESRPGIFNESSNGITVCNTSKLSCNGISELKKWARDWGAIHPYTPGSIPTGITPNINTPSDNSVTQITSQGNEFVTQNVTDDTKQVSVQAVQGGQPSQFGKKTCVRASSDQNKQEKTHTHTTFFDESRAAPPARLAQIIGRMNYKNPEGLTVTWGASAEEKQFEQGLLAAENMEELQIVKDSFSEELRVKIMAVWKKDGRKDLLVNKVERLKNEAIN